MAQGTKFIRVHGRIVPVRQKGGGSGGGKASSKAPVPAKKPSMAGAYAKHIFKGAASSALIGAGAAGLFNLVARPPRSVQFSVLGSGILSGAFGAVIAAGNAYGHYRANKNHSAMLPSSSVSAPPKKKRK